MTRETWNTFLDVMKEDRNTIVLDSTNEEENEENEEEEAAETEEE